MTDHFHPDADHAFGDALQQATLVGLVTQWMAGRYATAGADECGRRA